MTSSQAPQIRRLDNDINRIRREIVDKYLAHIENLKHNGSKFYFDFIAGLETGIFPKSSLLGVLTQAEVNEILGILGAEANNKPQSAPEIKAATRQRVRNELGLEIVQPIQRHSAAARVEHEKELLKGLAA